MKSEIDYTVKSQKSFDEAVDAVKEAAKEHDFGIQQVRDFQEILAKKGYEREPVKIVEVCNPAHAHAILKHDPRVALMLPCPVVIYEEDGEVFVTTVRASIISEMFPEVHAEEISEEVEEALIPTVDAAR